MYFLGYAWANKRGFSLFALCSRRGFLSASSLLKRIFLAAISRVLSLLPRCFRSYFSRLHHGFRAGVIRATLVLTSRNSLATPLLLAAYFAAALAIK